MTPMLSAVPDVERAREQAAEPALGDARPPAPPTGPDGLTPPRSRGGGFRTLADVIVELGFLSRERVDELAEEARAAGARIDDVIAESGGLTADQLARAKAERLGLDHVDLATYTADLGAVNLVTPQAARRYSAVPIGFDESGLLLVAMADPSNVLALDDLKLITGHEARRVVASPDDIAVLINRMNRLSDAVAEIAEEEDDAGAPVVEIRESAEDAPVVKLVNSIIAQAVQSGASDIHFEPDGSDMRVRFRIDGVLSEITSIPRRTVPGVISRVKIMGDLDISERRIPQDGRTTLRVEGKPIDIRIVTLPSVLGESIILRILDKGETLTSLDGLGMSDQDRRPFEEAFTRAHGAVLVTGPTGSGKSTTLYGALDALNSIEKKILTIEDPVESQMTGVNQIQVNNKAGLTFAQGLRSMLRADPDIIMVGEIRDTETAKIAVESALTGHMVLSTLHTNDAPSAISRLTEMGVEPFLTASALNCVVAQRLARKLCVYCRRATVVDTDALLDSGFQSPFGHHFAPDLEVHEPVGCARCGGTGYKGRIGLYEVMTMTEEIRALAIKRASADEIRNLAQQQGMRLLRDDGFEKVRQGITSVNEVLRVS